MTHEDVSPRCPHCGRPTRTVSMEHVALVKLSLNLPAEEADDLRRLAAEKKVSMTDVLRRGLSIERYIEDARRDGARFLVERGENVREVVFARHGARGMTLTGIGWCAECGALHDKGSRLDHCAECGNCFDHCACETVREEAERAEREAAERAAREEAERDWAAVSDGYAALPSPSARRAARPPRWR